MKWTTKLPKVSGYYWHKRFTEAGYMTPKVVKVTIKNDDPEWQEQFYTVCNSEGEYHFVIGDKWCGPIPPPK